LGATTQEKSPETLAQVRSIAGKQSTHGVIAGLKALRDRPDATPGLKQIAVPTLVIVGAEDLVTPIAKAEVLATEIPGAKLAILEGVGHLANLEDSMSFNTLVEMFLAGV
jgi:pimeloyl-ACP methyl ester carboxylesterase